MGRIAEKPALLDWLYRREFRDPFRIGEALSQGAKEVLGRSAAEADDYSEANADTFWQYLLSTQQERRRRGLLPPFEVLDEMAMTLSWCGVGQQLPASRQERRSRFRARRRPAMLRMIDALNDRQYEALGCVIAQLGGASDVFLTPHGGEGGVDFFALVPTPGRCHLFSGGIHPLRIVGQCKKHKRTIDEAMAKEFVETLQTVKYRGEPKIEKLVPAWFHATRGPIIGLLVSHAGFQSGADTKARNHGFILADSLDLAEIAALSSQIPEDLDAAARAYQCASRVAQMLSVDDGTLPTP